MRTLSGSSRGTVRRIGLTRCRSRSATRTRSIIKRRSPHSTAHQAYRLAYASGSLSGLLAVVRSGQAVAVLTRSAVPPDLRIQSRASGLPSLPQIGLTIRLNARRASPLTRAFAAHLRAILPVL